MVTFLNILEALVIGFLIKYLPFSDVEQSWDSKVLQSSSLTKRPVNQSFTDHFWKAVCRTGVVLGYSGWMVELNLRGAVVVARRVL